MRHRILERKLNRETGHRTSMLRNMSTDLIVYGKLETTYAKAKVLRPFVEKLVTKSKTKDINSIKHAKKSLFSVDAVRVLFDDIAPRFVAINGGYTRIVKLKNRKGDNALMARIEWSVSKSKAKVKVKVKEEKQKA